MWTKSTIAVVFAAAIGATIGLLFAFGAAGSQTAAALQPETTLITSRSAGPIEIGATLDTLSEFNVSPGSELDGDPNGFAVSRDGRVVAVVATAGGAESPIQLIVVLDPLFRTAANIGVGSTVAAAEAAYGTAILSHEATASTTSTAELLSVSSGPTGVRFLTSNDGGPVAGIYEEGASVTINYDPAATITSIWIDCRTRVCSAPVPSAAPTEAPRELATTGASQTGAFAGLLIVGGGLIVLGVRNVVRMVDHEARYRARGRS